jgi:hypothetical protein
MSSSSSSLSDRREARARCQSISRTGVTGCARPLDRTTSTFEAFKVSAKSSDAREIQTLFAANVTSTLRTNAPAHHLLPLRPILPDAKLDFIRLRDWCILY